MKVKLKPADAFSVEVEGTDAGFFLQVSAWEGLAKLQNSEGGTLIVVLPAAHGTAAAISRVFGCAQDATVVMASPDLISKLQANSAEPASAENYGGSA